MRNLNATLCLTLAALLGNAGESWSADMPENAYVSGNAWYCNKGYSQSGNKCVRLIVPENAYVSGNAWYCNKGYSQSGNKCVRLTPQKFRQYQEKLLRLRALNRRKSGGQYMSCEGETENGKPWSGECYLYSEKYGDLESAETEDGKEVTGECYKYSSRYADVESAETEDGKEVTGECSY
jgi:hypothetical protein